MHAAEPQQPWAQQGVKACLQRAMKPCHIMHRGLPRPPPPCCGRSCLRTPAGDVIMRIQWALYWAPGSSAAAAAPCRRALHVPPLPPAAATSCCQQLLPLPAGVGPPADGDQAGWRERWPRRAPSLQPHAHTAAVKVGTGDASGISVWWWWCLAFWWRGGMGAMHYTGDLHHRTCGPWYAPAALQQVNGPEHSSTSFSEILSHRSMLLPERLQPCYQQ